MIAHGKDIKIFTGNSNPRLAEAIASILGVKVGSAKVGQFSDGETSVSINESVRGSDVFVVQSTSTPVNDNLMELLIMIDAFHRASAGRITAVIPYYGYARQDRKSKARDPISAKLVADLICTAGADRALTIDLHAPQIQGFFNVPVDHLLGVPVLAPYFIDLFGVSNPDVVAVSPDIGSMKRTRSFAQKLDSTIATVDKRRPQANVSEVMNIIGDVKNKSVILVDDMIDTAGTLCNAAKALIEIGGAKEIYACATHGVLSGKAFDRINESPIKELVILDTVRHTEEELEYCPKLKILPVAPVFAEAIERIYEDLPVSTLFV